MFDATTRCLDGLGDGHASPAAKIAGEELDLERPEPLMNRRALSRALAQAGGESSDESTKGALREVGTGIREGVLDRLLGAKRR